VHSSDWAPKINVHPAPTTQLTSSALLERRSARNTRLAPLNLEARPLPQHVALASVRSIGGDSAGGALTCGESSCSTSCGSSSSLGLEASTNQLGIRHLEAGEKIYDLYHWEEVLQESGDGGKVVRCQSKTADSCAEKRSYVMKMKSKESLRSHGMEGQFRATQLRMLNIKPHVGVLPVHQVLEDSSFYYVVMEEAAGGALFNSLIDEFQDGVMPDDAVRRVIREVLEALGHVHKQGMLHRDVKPDNLVVRCFRGATLNAVSNTKKVALIDFDHADPAWSPAQQARVTDDMFGTLRFNAPETFLGMFSAQSDLYSVGVILYLLLTGNLPYSDDLFLELESEAAPDSPRRSWRVSVYGRMQQAPINWSCDPWPEKDSSCMAFCESLLAFHPERRPMSAEAALEHTWFTRTFTSDCGGMSVPVSCTSS